jgi:hypothetical protein
LTRRRGISIKFRHNGLRKGDFHAISTNVALKNRRAECSLEEKIPQTVIAGNSGICVSAIKLVASILDLIEYRIHEPIDDFAAGAFDTRHEKGATGGRVDAIADFGWCGNDKFVTILIRFNIIFDGTFNGIGSTVSRRKAIVIVESAYEGSFLSSIVKIGAIAITICTILF